jgi:hypothetical protein
MVKGKSNCPAHLATRRPFGQPTALPGIEAPNWIHN